MPFPTTGILDNFNRADENPLATAGNWRAPILTTTGTFKLASNVLIDDSLADGGGGGSAYWNPTFGPGLEVFVTMPAVWANLNHDFWFWICGSGENTAGVNGYKCTIGFNTGVWYYNMFRIDAGVETEIGPSYQAGPSLNAGDSVGVEHDGVSLRFYYKAAAGAWGTAAGVSPRSDATYTSGHIGVHNGFNDVTTTLDDFGGGTRIPPILTKPMYPMAFH